MGSGAIFLSLLFWAGPPREVSYLDGGI